MQVVETKGSEKWGRSQYKSREKLTAAVTSVQGNAFIANNAVLQCK